MCGMCTEKFFLGFLLNDVSYEGSFENRKSLETVKISRLSVGASVHKGLYNTKHSFINKNIIRRSS